MDEWTYMDTMTALVVMLALCVVVLVAEQAWRGGLKDKWKKWLDDKLG